MDFDSLLIGTRGGLYEAGRSTPMVPGASVAGVAVLGSQAWATAGRTLWHRAGDHTWERVASADVDLTCVSATGTGVFAGTAGAHLLTLHEHGLEKVDEFERAEGRGDWFTPWGGPPAVRSMSHDGSALYVNVHVGGILRSGNDGAGWSQLIDIHSDVHQVVALRSGLIVAATARGLARSVDAGTTWGFYTDGLDATYSRAVAVDGDSLYMSASEGPRGGRACLYRCALDGDVRFARCSDFFEGNIDTGCVLASGGAVAIGSQDGRVLGSRGGESWTMLASRLPAVTALA